MVPENDYDDRRHPEFLRAPNRRQKPSGLGPPEDGIRDREFYNRPQAVYR